MKKGIIIAIILIMAGLVACEQRETSGIQNSNNVISNTIQNTQNNQTVENKDNKQEVDQKNPEKVVRAYFTFIEEKSYEKAWELTSDKEKKSYPKEIALKEHWGIESLKLENVQKEQQLEEDKAENTLLYTADFTITPSPGTAWGEGVTKTGRYVNLVKQSDEKWYINGLATGK